MSHEVVEGNCNLFQVKFAVLSAKIISQVRLDDNGWVTTLNCSNGPRIF